MPGQFSPFNDMFACPLPIVSQRALRCAYTVGAALGVVKLIPCQVCNICQVRDLITAQHKPGAACWEVNAVQLDFARILLLLAAMPSVA